MASAISNKGKIKTLVRKTIISPFACIMVKLFKDKKLETSARYGYVSKLSLSNRFLSERTSNRVEN